MQALILAAGFGTRLHPLTLETPKPLLKVGKISLIERQITNLKRANITDLVINVGYLGEQIRQHLGDGSIFGVKISYSIEPPKNLLETGGAIIQALKLGLLKDPKFLVVNSDILTSYNFSNLVNFPLENNNLAHLVLVDNPAHNLTGDFELTNNLVINKKAKETLKFTYSGIGLFSAKLFKDLELQVIKLLAILVPAIDRQKVTGEYFSDFWMDVGTNKFSMHPGVIIGVLVGLLFGGVGGSLVGGVVSYYLIRKIQSSLNQQSSSSMIDSKLLEVLFLALGKIAKSDGVVKDQHIECARYEISNLELDFKDGKQAMISFNRGKYATNFAEALAPFAARKDIGYWLLSACWRMAWADGYVGLREKQVLIQLGAALNISVAQVLALGREYQPNFEYQQNFIDNSYSEALQLLGVNAEHSYEQVKKAYRKLLSKNHPDKLAGIGANQAQIKRATELTNQINNAYKTICDKQNWR